MSRARISCLFWLHLFCAILTTSSYAQHSGTAPAVGQGQQVPAAIENPALCREKIKELLKSRLFTLQKSIYVYHWFNNRPGQYHVDEDSPSFQKRIHELAVSKANRFYTVNENETAGQGMYFAADPISSVLYGTDGTDNPDNMKNAMLVRLELKPGFRAVRLLLGDIHKEAGGYALPTDKACVPERVLVFGDGKAPTLPLLREVAKELGIDGLAFPFLYANYDSPLDTSKIDFEKEAQTRVAFNVLNPDYVKNAAVKGFRGKEFEFEKLPPHPSMEQLFAYYYGLYDKKQTPKVREDFRKWNQERLLPSRSFDELFQPISKQ